MQTSQNRPPFSPDVLQALAAADEVQIEPASGRARVIIWVVVADGSVYVRSYKGPRGRWYQQLQTQPAGMLHLDGRQIPFRASPADDEQTTGRVSQAFRDKYEQRWPSETAEMLRDDVLATTLELIARDT